MRLPFFKLFSNVVHFCPNLQIFYPFLSFSWKIARMTLLSRIGPVRSCRSYDEVFRVWFFETIHKLFLSGRDFLWKVYTYWCKEIIEIFCFFYWVSNGIIISNYGKYVTTFLCFLGDMISCRPLHILLESFLFYSKWFW